MLMWNLNIDIFNNEYLAVTANAGFVPYSIKRSSDRNLIEHLWDKLKRRVRSRIPACALLRVFAAALVEE